MTGDRRKEIVRHLSEDDLDRLLAETDDVKISKRLIFLKRLYKGATLEDLPTTSASPQPLRLAGYDDGIRVDSARTSRNNCSNSCGRVNPGNHRRSSTFSTKSSTLSTIQLTSEDSS